MEHLSKRSWLGRRISRAWITLAVATVALPIPSSFGAEPFTSGLSLSALSFEELSQIQVTTASKHPESLANSPAAIYVLTGEDIHRSGVTTLPDAFRYVPGMDVAMINSSQWGVSARGFCGQYANQLLVMIDGRSVYNSAFGGVLWSGQDVLLEDLERIEIVRGPGGALWGANAVNGVINILTKSAKDTQGAMLKVGAGTFQEALVAAREGLKFSDKTFARVYVKYESYDQVPLTTGGASMDDWWRLQGGFRLDSELSETSTVTLQSDFYRVDAGAVSAFPLFTVPYSSIEAYRFIDTGANVLGRWARQFTADSTLTAQAYYDYYDRTSPSGIQRLETLDADLQHNLRWGDAQQINWGVGYRDTIDTIGTTPVISVPGREQANDQLFNIFAQDEIALMGEKLFFTLGAKFEHNDYTGWELSPSVRLLWHPAEKQTVWGAVSRAVTTPNHLSTGMAFNLRVAPPGTLGPGSQAALVQIQGKSDRVEELLAYEIGYRIQLGERVSVDVAAFDNNYSQLLITETGSVIPGSPPIIPVNWLNQIDGHTHGVEVALGWQPLVSWRLQGNYTWFESDVAKGSVGRGDGNASPRHKASLRSTVDLNAAWEWDVGLRFVDELESIAVPSYLEMDVRLAWKPKEHWELAVVGQNLLDSSHYEYPRGLSSYQSEAPRSVYATVTWKY